MKKILYITMLCIPCALLIAQELTQEQEQIQEQVIEQFAKIIFKEAMDAKKAYQRAQVREEVIDNYVTTAPMQNFVANADIQSVLADGIESATINVSTDNQLTWQSSNASLLGSDGYENTWEAVVPTSGGNTSHSYLSGVVSSEALGYDYGTLIVSGSPNNESGVFPLSDNLYAVVSEDISGDAPSQQDIVSIRASYRGSDAIDSDGNEYTDVDRYYLAMTLDGSCCDTDPGGFWGFLGPFYLYGMAIVNPESEEAVAYAIGYGDGGTLGGSELYPGVLKITGDLESGEIGGFEYLTSNINYNTSGNTLQASSPMSIITSDSQWGVWPNSYNGFITLGITVSAGIDNGEIATDILDQTNPGLFICNTSNQVGNSPLELSNAQYDSSSKTVSVEYFDADNNLPWFKSAQICPPNDGPCYFAFDLVPDSHIYDENVTFSGIIPQDLIDQFEVSGDNVVKLWFADSEISDYPSAQIQLDISLDAACSPGDANADGILNVLDVVLLVGVILEGVSSGDECSDITGDGVLNVLDVVSLVNIILNP